MGSRFYSIKNHGIFLSEKRALFLMDTWFYLVWYWMLVLGVGGWGVGGWVHVLGVGESVVGGRGEGGDLATGFHGITRDLEGGDWGGEI